ncbi:MAG: indole-3-glycerol phosphate synthase TrpC [Acidobacteriota bacterium]
MPKCEVILARALSSMLNAILADKRRDLSKAKVEVPWAELVSRIRDAKLPSLKEVLARPEVNIIAEIKYRSPSRGDFRCHLRPKDLAALYVENGAAAISVLTEKDHFKGDLQFLQIVSDSQPGLPVLRKDFIFDRYQVVETRVKRASAFLLIAACLSKEQLQSLMGYGEELGLEALVEVHGARELETALESGARLIGVNNRNLESFEVDIQTSFDLARRMEVESGCWLISESGIRERSQILELRDAGFSAFLIGSILMDAPDPGKKLGELLGVGS